MGSKIRYFLSGDDDDDKEEATMRTMIAMIIIVKVKVEEIPVEYAWVEKQPEARSGYSFNIWKLFHTIVHENSNN